MMTAIISGRPIKSSLRSQKYKARRASKPSSAPLWRMGACSFGKSAFGDAVVLFWEIIRLRDTFHHPHASNKRLKLKKENKMKKLSFVMAACLCGWALAAAAQDAPTTGQDQGGASAPSSPTPHKKGKRHGACAKDIKNLCPNAKTWKAKRKCLNDNQGSLSSACQAQMKKMSSHVTAFKKACKADVNQFCAAVKGKGPKAMFRCLKQNSANLSSSCQSFLAKAKKKWKNHQPQPSSNSSSTQPMQQ